MSPWFVVCLPLLSSAVTAQVRIEKPYDVENPGIRHVDVDGRVLSAAGWPLGGVRVRLASPFRLESAASRETQTDSSGRFSFQDVNGDDRLLGLVEPPPEWVPATFHVSRNNGGKVGVGDIRLTANTSLQVVVETADGSIVKGSREDVNVFLRPHGTYSAGLANDYANGVFTIGYIPYRAADLMVRIGRKKTYSAPLKFEPGQRNRFIIARIPRQEKKDDNEAEKLDIVEMVRLAEPASPRTREGVVRAPDGSPLEGAVVSVAGNSIFDGIQRSATAVTGADGRFRLTEPPGGISETLIALVGAVPRAIPEGGNQGESRDYRIAGAVPLELGADAPAAAGILRVRWWHEQLGWQTLSKLKTWVVRWATPTDSVPAGAVEAPSGWLVGDLPGYFPIVMRLELPVPGGAPVQPIVQRFHFSDSPVRTLEVRAMGKPLAGAKVDLVRVDGVEGFAGFPLATYTSGADGKLRLAGAPEGIYEAFLYAPGYAPAHAIWEPGAPAIVTLAPASTVLEVYGVVRGERIAFRRPGSSETVAVVQVTQTPVRVAVAAGAYDISAADDSGYVVAGARATASGQTMRVSLTAQPPTEVGVQLPDRAPAYAVSETRLMKPIIPGYPPFNAPEEWELIPESQLIPVVAGEGPASVRVRVSGLCRVEIRASNTFEMMRTMEVATGQRMVLRAPSATASLRGTVPETLPGFGREGVQFGRTGVQVSLRAADPDGWDVEALAIEIGPDGSFRIDGLPAGRYYVWLHAVKATTDLLGDFNPPLADQCAKHAWGGVPVTLKAGEETVLKRFAAAAIGTLKLRVTDADGRPIPSAHVFVRDPYLECPYGESHLRLPVVRVANGAAEVSDVRAGRLQFYLLADTGRVYPVSADVKPGSPLAIRLPRDDR